QGTAVVAEVWVDRVAVATDVVVVREDRRRPVLHVTEEQVARGVGVDEVRHQVVSNTREGDVPAVGADGWFFRSTLARAGAVLVDADQGRGGGRKIPDVDLAVAGVRDELAVGA